MTGGPVTGSDGLGRPWRIVLLVSGALCVALGAVGVVLPVLPTTPFLLLAAACFLRSSPRLHQWLLRSRVLGAYIHSYHEGGGVPLRAKVVAIALLWLTIGYSIGWVVEALWLRILLTCIAVAVTWHIGTRPSPRSPS